jgi:enterobactin synthetase component D
MVVAAPNPGVFSGFVAQHSVSFDPASLGDENSFPGIELPARLAKAVRKRKYEFLAGRHCAAEAMRALLPAAPVPAVGLASDRSPQWPPGIVGSITHCTGFASAAVTRVHDAQAIGIDSEDIMSEARAARIVRMVADDRELAELKGSMHISLPHLITLLFSAKEALFKCLYPAVGRHFGFNAARMTAIDVQRGCFEITLTTTLGDDLPAGKSVPGRYTTDAGRVHTGILIPRLPQRHAL